MNTRYGKTRARRSKSLICKHLCFAHDRGKASYQALDTRQMARKIAVVIISYHIIHGDAPRTAKPNALLAGALVLGKPLGHTRHGSVRARLEDLANTLTAVQIAGVTV